MTPRATAALSSGANVAQAPNTPKNSATMPAPSAIGVVMPILRQTENRSSVASTMALDLRDLLAAGFGKPSKDLLSRTEVLHLSLTQHEDLVDMLHDVRPVADDDDRDLALLQR